MILAGLSALQASETRMEKWMAYAFVSMFFAGFTSVIAKMGLAGISGELGLTVRTSFVGAFVLAFAVWVVPTQMWPTSRAGI